MPYASIRFTLDPSSGRTADRVFKLCHYLHDKYKSEFFQSSCGLEMLNKYGEPTLPHVHYNFYYEQHELIDPKRSLVSVCRKYADKHEFALRGPQAWCLQLFPEPEDIEHENRWFRYPLKENMINHLTSLQLRELQPFARDERTRSVEANCIARDKARDKVQFKDKLFSYLKNKLIPKPPPNHNEIWVTICEYYKQEGKPINFTTISGYTVLYQLEIGTLSFQSAYENHIINSNQFS